MWQRQQQITSPICGEVARYPCLLCSDCCVCLYRAGWRWFKNIPRNLNSLRPLNFRTRGWKIILEVNNCKTFRLSLVLRIRWLLKQQIRANCDPTKNLFNCFYICRSSHESLKLELKIRSYSCDVLDLRCSCQILSNVQMSIGWDDGWPAAGRSAGRICFPPSLVVTQPRPSVSIT